MSCDPLTVASSLAGDENLTLRAIGWGTLIAGTLDIAAAVAMYLPRGVGADRVFQSVASGLLGRASYQGGAPTAALGLLMHFLIMSIIASLFVIASRHFNALVRHPLVSGAFYGVVVFAAMNFIVVPLSAAGGGKAAVLRDLLLQVGIHIVCVGLPIALIARRFAR